MQELIEDIKRVIPAFKLEIYEQNFNAYLEKEKEQIIIAYIHNRYVLAGGHPIRRDYAEE